jgi:hypothetical protein
VLTTVAVVAAPGIASAAPRHNRGLTINATPNPIIAGEGVLIYGQLRGTDITGKTIVLYHHVSGSHMGYTRIGATTTDSHGFYEFTRAEGVVTTNRSWFVREPGVRKVHSRTVFERVAALVSLTANTTTADTGQPITFSGHVTPSHASERVALQEQVGSSDDWKTLKTGLLDGSSNYSIAYRWRVPGDRDVRVVLPGDVRNVRSESDPLTVSIQQAQVADFTINSSSPIIPEGSSATISGVLHMPTSTTREPSTSVTLWGRTHSQSKFRAIQSMPTGADGSYSFTVQPTQNELYQVRTTFVPHLHTAVLFEGVRDVVTLAASSTSSTVGGQVRFTGNVDPDKAGHLIYLQRLGADGDWHTVRVNLVRLNSTYQFVRSFGKAGTAEFRTRIDSDFNNVGAASPPVTITVTGLAPVATLPPAS